MMGNQLHLAPGKWLMADCGKHASEKNCKIIFLAPEAQREDLLDALENHAITSHRHEKSPELKNQIKQVLEVIEVK
jgi:hypothetical protein